MLKSAGERVQQIAGPGGGNSQAWWSWDAWLQAGVRENIKAPAPLPAGETVKANEE